jgi:polysaccharide pyruvyl transferase WcaK-like protein
VAVTHTLASPESDIALRVDLTSKKIGLLDHMGFGNMGDAAIHESFVQNIKKRFPNARLIAFSQNPSDTKIRHNIECFPINWNYPLRNASQGRQASPTGPEARLRSLVNKSRTLQSLGRRIHSFGKELAHLARSFRVLRALDLLILAGGGQLCDLWWAQPYNVFKFCALARLARTPVFIVGVGADLISARSSRFYARWSVRLATYVSFRDAESRALIRNLGVTREMHVCPDPAYGLDLHDYELSQSSRTPGRKVGLNPMGFCDARVWPRQDAALYNSYLDKLAQFSSWLLAQNYDLELFTSDLGVDKYALDDLMERILTANFGDLSRRVVCRPVADLHELLSQMETFDFVITPKFHGVIFSHLLEKPVVALSYLPKIDYLTRHVGTEQYCLNIEHFNVTSLIDSFTTLVQERDKLKDLFRETSQTCAAALRAEFDNLVLAMVPQGECVSEAGCGRLKPHRTGDPRE